MITEEMMASAAAEMNDAMLRSLPDQEDFHHTFSTKFERKMKRLIYRTDHPIQTLILQRVASVILVLFVGLATIMAISPTVRAHVLGWIRERYESFIAYYFVDELCNETSNGEYYIDCLDTEYTLIYSSNEDDIHFQIYADSDGGTIHFIYAANYTRNIMYIKQDKYEITPVSINDNVGDLYISIDGTEKNSIIWCDEQSRIMFYLSADIDPESLILFAENRIRK